MGNGALGSRTGIENFHTCNSHSLPSSRIIFTNIFVSLALLCSHGACIYYIGTEQKVVVLQCRYTVCYTPTFPEANLVNGIIITVFMPVAS